VRDGWEVMADDNPPRPARALKFMAAMIADKPADAEVTTGYRGKSRFLMLYGPGALTRMPVIRRHVAAGGRVAMWDLGYWDRERSMRLSFDTLHPSAEQLAAVPAGARREFVLREDANPNGPIVLIGLGYKSNRAWGLQAFEWERAKLADLRRRFPGREILWRPKGGKPQPFAGLRMDYDTPIADLLRGASLVACRHSNASVDACVAGVPVECDDGAAAALYRGNPNPTREQRAEFLRRLSFFEWSRDDAPAAWAFIRGAIGG
jgi:hypothetical protein